MMTDTSDPVGESTRVTNVQLGTMPADVHQKDVRRIGCSYLIVSALMLLIPVAGPILFVVGIVIAIWQTQTEKPPPVFTGPCPVCTSSIWVPTTIAAFDCPLCRKRILVRNQQFVFIE